MMLFSFFFRFPAHTVCMSQLESQILKQWKWLESLVIKKRGAFASREEMLHFLLTKLRGMHSAASVLLVERQEKELQDRDLQKQAIEKQMKKSAQEVLQGYILVLVVGF